MIYFIAPVGCGPIKVGYSINPAKRMKSRESIPPKHWLAVAQAARTEGLDGITFEALAEMNGPDEANPDDPERATA
jgi:hypothetical protein